MSGRNWEEILSSHPYFIHGGIGGNGRGNYILKERVGTYQKALYFVTHSIAGTHEWLWFRYANPPSISWTLAAVKLDPSGPRIITFPGMVLSGNPCLSEDGITAYVPVEDKIFSQHIDGSYHEVLRMPKELARGRYPFLLVTDLTISADGEWFLFDSHIGNEFVLWEASRDGKTWRVLHRFERKFHHCAFSLHDPDIYLVNEGPGNHPITGERINIDRRVWIGNRKDGSLAPAVADLRFHVNSMNCHEWWTSSGRVHWCDYNDGIYEVNPKTQERILVWNRVLTHGQTSPCVNWIVGDENPYNWNDRKPCSVWLFHLKTRTEQAVARNLPPPPFDWKDWRKWHPDPHPHFSGDGKLIVYTTGEGGNLNVGLSPVPG